MNLVKNILGYPWWIKFCTIMRYNWRFKSCGKKVIIRTPLIITPNCIELGYKVYVMPHCRIEGIHLYAGEKFSPLIKIGNRVSIQQNLHLTCAKNIIIGDDTAIAANVTITDINHTYADVNIPIECQSLDVRSVTIGSGCKIYNNSVILPGTILGNHCIVGANSVVNGIFNDFSVIVGAPAKVIKKYNIDTNKWEKV